MKQYYIFVCFGLYVQAFSRLVMQVIMQKCKRKNCVCFLPGDQPQDPSVHGAGNCSLFFGEIKTLYQEALRAMSGTYCFVCTDALCPPCLSQCPPHTLP